MTEQQRVPRGVPEGGQFAQSERGEANLDLRPLDGSFLYPPVFSTAEEVISFWSRVEIPDEVLARAERVYKDYYADIIEHWPEVAWSYEEWDWNAENPQPEPGDAGAVADWEGRKRGAQADYEERMKQVLSARPETLDRRDVRPLVRAAAMFRSAANDLDWDGYQAVCQHPVALTTGPKPVRAAAFESGFSGVARQFLDAEYYPLDGVSQEDIERIVNQSVSKAIGEQNAAIDRAFDELTDHLGRVGNAVIDMHGPTKRGRF